MAATPSGAHVPGHISYALRVKIRNEGSVRNKAEYLALGVLRDGILDIWRILLESTENAKFRMKVFNDLKTRGEMCYRHHERPESDTRGLVNGISCHDTANLHLPFHPQQPRLCGLG